MSAQSISDLTGRFLCGDCQQVMAEIPDSSVNLVFTSPPYADQRRYQNAKDGTIHPDQYVEWFMPKAREIYRILKEDGSFILNINSKVYENFEHLYIFELVVQLCKELGFHLVQDYIWHNPAAPPNVYSTGKYGRTKKSHEYIFWFAKGTSWTFNMDPIRKPYSNKINEILENKREGDRNRNTHPSSHSFNYDTKWEDKNGSDPGSLLSLSNTSSNDYFMKICRKEKISHPARFPETLAEFFLLAGNNENDIVLDPFSGSRTTAAAAERLNRRWIGIDASQDYCLLAQKRMESINNQLEENSHLLVPFDYTKKWSGWNHLHS